MDFHGRITHAAAKEAQDSSHARELEMLVGIGELVMLWYVVVGWHKFLYQVFESFEDNAAQE